ncbi:MAG: FAD-binding oxidoreductase [Wenzhouxiangellaceae bacterium]|nr:FAD-binding oxidoreductase [Wenzhouxiangellaceae bacterium]
MLDTTATVSDEGLDRQGPDHQGFISAISTILPDAAIVTDPLLCLTNGTDASFYRLVPKAILYPETESQVSRILAMARRFCVPLTFRAAGTSLSGQGVTDSILVKIGPAWKQAQVGEHGESITLGPAVIGAHANRMLAPYGRRIGPDPASLDAAQIGGIVACNSSGMCCGTAQNSYQTLRGARLILADGTTLDSADDVSRAEFSKTHGEFLGELKAISDEVKRDTELAELIERKFSIKNTCGFSLNALIDFTDPVDILTHLMVGSEGTLGFISSFSYTTVEDPAHKATALAVFSDVRTACMAVARLEEQPVTAVELMDGASLRSVHGKPGMPEELDQLPREAAALLIECGSADPRILESQVDRVTRELRDIEMLTPLEFTEDAGRRTALWAVRKGTFPSVGAMRPPGTHVIIEDVAVPTAKLADAVLELRESFSNYGYDDAIIFGHALAGNIHFVLTPDLGTTEALDRYGMFMDELASLIAGRYQGSLKAEHGTGRNMAPYVELEWGEKAYDLMWRLKRLFDPAGILNPGVILNEDRNIHMQNIKPLPLVDSIVDKCIECGFCEPVCPTREYTTTPRQRIVGLREISRLKETGEAPDRMREMVKSYEHQAIASCAGDGLCGQACPVGINTGKMMTRLRSQAWGRTGPGIASFLGRRFATVMSMTRWGLAGANLAHRILGARAMSALSRGARKLSGGRVPLWMPAMPTPARLARPGSFPDQERPRVVYFPSCASRTMGPALGDPEKASLSTPVVSLLEKAGYQVVFPDSIGGLCCGKPFDSKGLFNEAERKFSELENGLRAASRGGQDPIVFDTSPCAYRAAHEHACNLKIHDLPDFLATHVLPKLDVVAREKKVAMHTTCSTLKAGTEQRLHELASACSEQVVQPSGIKCCGWAGSLGFTLPEVNASALRTLAGQLPDDCAEGVSSSRTCEIGLSNHGARPYRSIAYLLDRCTEPREHR